MKKTVLITGSSSGFGKLAAMTFHNNGWNVIATMRTPEKEKELVELENVLVTALDVTKSDSVKSAVAQGISRFGDIDVLVNNAGFGGHAFLEQFTDEDIRDMFETNVFGVIRVSREVLPYLRRKKEGTIVNVTSMAGYMGIAMGSVYAASKHAAEGLTESMAMEYKPFNIKVRAVAPGAFGTNFFEATKNNLENGDEEIRSCAGKMIAHFEALGEQMRQHAGNDADPQDVTDLIYRCATENMPVHNIVGSDAKMLYDSMSSLSREAFIDQMTDMFIPKDL